ncbi:MAG: DNA-binding protein [Deltaproteobacteria bacterium]|nr:DNA-binding protein [Deltaproteobacteria bacterium]TLN03813.1 MAG: helix-turn-helix domain-containing protein [bacterium]
MSRKNRKQQAGKSTVQHQSGISQGVVHAPEPVTPVEKKKTPRSVKSDVLPLLLTLVDVCALLNVSRSTVIRLEKAGGLPGRVTVGASVRYHRLVNEEWLLDQAKGQERKNYETI